MGRAVSARLYAATTNNLLLVTSPLCPSKTYSNVLPDTGANFDAVNIDIVRKYKLRVITPSRAHKCIIAGAFTGMSSARLGYVIMRVTVHFPLRGDHHNAITFTKCFEVTEMHNDFILATGYEGVIS